MKVREGVDKWRSFGRTMWKSAARILNHKSWRMVKKLCFQNKNLTFAEINELR